MRLFIAIDLSEETRAHLRRVRSLLEAQLAAARHAPRVTWVADDAAHVTLRFIGEVPDDTADRVRAAMATRLPGDSYTLQFGGVGVFPNARRPRVIWIGVTAGQAATAALARAVDTLVSPIVGPWEEREFSAHLSVGRVKEAGRFEWPRLLDSVPAMQSSSQVDHVTLYQSRTSPRGPTYTALSVAALGGHQS